ncbi:hypothetical protein QZH41_004277 [Actinostola sp. cb2023]|nr:hypothetical protein QZH41_004277 [Actinostola sp. cb2023]
MNLCTFKSDTRFERPYKKCTYRGGTKALKLYGASLKENFIDHVGKDIIRTDDPVALKLSPTDSPTPVIIDYNKTLIERSLVPWMDYELEQMSEEVLVEERGLEIKTLRDVRRYDKKTLLCPGGCGAQLQLHEITKHECLQYLKDHLQHMEDNVDELESRVGEMVAMEAYYKNNLSDLENKFEEMTEEMRVLVLERNRRDEIFSSKETFYKEQTIALKEQVSRLEKRVHEERSRRPTSEDDDVEYDIQRVEKDWALRYDKLLAEKITIETLYQRKDRQYQQDMNAMKQEVCALRDSLRLEREVMALEYDQANFEKLQSLIDQLEELVREKKDSNAGMKGNENMFHDETGEDYVTEGNNQKSHFREQIFYRGRNHSFQIVNPKVYRTTIIITTTPTNTIIITNITTIIIATTTTTTIIITTTTITIITTTITITAIITTTTTTTTTITTTTTTTTTTIITTTTTTTTTTIITTTTTTIITTTTVVVVMMVVVVVAMVVVVVVVMMMMVVVVVVVVMMMMVVVVVVVVVVMMMAVVVVVVVVVW